MITYPSFQEVQMSKWDGNNSNITQGRPFTLRKKLARPSLTWDSACGVVRAHGKPQLPHDANRVRSSRASARTHDDRTLEELASHSSHRFRRHRASALATHPSLRTRMAITGKVAMNDESNFIVRWLRQTLHSCPASRYWWSVAGL